MPVVTPEKLATLQQNAEDVRNVSLKVPKQKRIKTKEK